MLEAIGLALAAAAREGRPDVVAELAAIAARVTGEERRAGLERAGVPMLGAVHVRGRTLLEP